MNEGGDVENALWWWIFIRKLKVMLMRNLWIYYCLTMSSEWTSERLEWDENKAINIPWTEWEGNLVKKSFLKKRLNWFSRTRFDYGFITDRLRLILCQFCRLLIARDRLILISWLYFVCLPFLSHVFKQSLKFDLILFFLSFSLQQTSSGW